MIGNTGKHNPYTVVAFRELVKISKTIYMDEKIL